MTKDIKSKRSLEINNHDMTLIKDIIQYIFEPLKNIFNLSIQINTFTTNMKNIFNRSSKYIFNKIILLTKINIVVFPDQIQQYHY